ncbi:P-loop containing nucleoside triphosphate hydrolase protein [Phascolomyces articulosus]|uniref:P-loop containing nucleoside triphosphate hydrolase protein n=1 Tax=Phascolomyces articulosus TaxID=60185 RepID=A0AAD5K4M6_9FUNG|nr:P-loop containing nucleoside triphosphate hydrolase protein [Phascolomyces articulosus]
MTLLTKITNEAINENLEKRWKNGEIYASIITYIGHVLISVNPFRDLGIYTDQVLGSYRGKNLLEMPPHVFAIAEAAYHHMSSYKENQCVIISGESGAGKTEAAKRIMQYIAAVSGGGQNSSIQEIKDMVLATNPLLESFGCAKTLRNNNSSRHGKYLEIQFNAQGEPVGAVITNYLLEKNRVVGQIENERNFHVFYQLTKAAPPEYQEAYGLQGPESFLYTSRSGCLDVEGINDVTEYSETIKAMDIVGLQKHEQDEIFKMLAVVLWLGNLLFVEGDDGNAAISDPDVANFIAYLMEVDGESLSKALTSRVMETQRGGRRGSVYEVPLNVTQATAVRDALAKAVYERLFEWIVQRVNLSLQTRGGDQYVIGVLDIYGFEIFDDNSFEQLCINYVNEKLQQIFIELTLKAEQEEYVREQIQWTPIKFFNNKIVCDLIEEKRPPGVFAALNDACATAHADPSAADNSFVQRLGFLSSNAHFESRGSKFLIRHYAGDVLYNVEGMTDKNKDSLLKDLLNLAAASTNSFIAQTLFPERIDPNSKKRPPTAGDKIKLSCNALVTKLMQCHPSYIRTIKPNDNRSSSEFNDKRVLHQVQYLGLCENIRVRRAGFAYRTTFEKFVERFYLLCPATGYAGDYIWQGDSVSGCLEILKHNNIPQDEWQMGTSKVFIRHPETIFALENLRDKYWHNMATRIQRAWRAYVRYKWECARKIQRFWRQNKYNIGYLQAREYGHELLGGRKERRRFSLLSMRKFTGDYLDVRGGTGLATMIRNALTLKGGEEVVFSMRGMTLVPRAMRSSVPSPRTLVLTNQSLHVLVTTKNGKMITMTDEKILSLNVISSVSTSTLRDDWIVLHVDNSPDGDTILSCIFKTELMVHLAQQSGGRIRVDATPQIQYKKKGGKTVTMKFVKNEKIPRDDVYKSHVVNVPSGESANSASMPPCPTKPRLTATSSRKPAARKPAASAARSAPRPKPAAAISSPATSRPLPPIQNNARPTPPPPPPAPATPSHPQFKAIYPFQSQEAGEIAFEKDDLLEIVEKDENGWWLARKDGKEGWVPSNYLEEYVAPKPTPAPPPPPARRAAPPPPPSAGSATSSSPKPRSSISPPSIGGGSTAPVAVMPGIAAPSSNGVPPWKAQLEARKAAAAGGSGGSPAPTPAPRPGPGAAPVPAARRAPPAPGPKPAIPAKPSTMGKPVIPARPGSGAPTPAPRAPPRPTSTSPPSNAAASLADAVSVIK